MGDWSIATRRKLLAWYRRRRRDLPWRRMRDPYAIWVSEVMLQQTRVAAVIPYYERFLRRFPDVGALARARLDSVLAVWSGLGYYRRARMLHAAARRVAGRGLPQSSAELRRLPGIGAYTAAAIASIAFGEAVAVVDGNVERVLCRLHARPDRRGVPALAREWIGPRAPGTHNQAVMELGATVCLPRSPDCPRCPLKSHCRGRDAPNRYPAPRSRKRPIERRVAAAFVEREGRVLLVRNGKGGPLEGMWELPASRSGGRPLVTVRHSILDRRLVIDVFPGRPRAAGRWFTARQTERLPLATAARKCLRELGFLNSERA